MKVLEQKATVKTLDETTRELQEFTRALTRENIDEALEKLTSSIQLLDQFADAKARLYEKVSNLKSKREIYTLQELLDFENLERALKSISYKIEMLQIEIEKLENKIVSLLPKPKEHFRVRTQNHIVEVEGDKILRVERI